MAREDETIKERLKKIEEMRKLKIEPYAYRFDAANKCSELQEKYKKLENEKFAEGVSVAGRVLSIRDIGKIAFLVLQDFSGKIQIVIQEGETDKKQIEFFKKFVDSGDIIGVNGKIFRTKRGELSILVKKIEMLTKSVKPIPDNFYGLQDKEERYRKRYLDLILDNKVKKIFEIRAKTLEAMREFMKQNNFLEVETPLLQSIYGGAAAKPFRTHCDAFNSDVFLSIAPELYLKKAMVGGLGSVYEITKKFRNEGVDRSHNPEHMTIEWYQENADYIDGMKLFEEFMKYVSLKVFGRSSFEYKGNVIDLSKWETLTLEEAIKKYLKEDVSKIKTDIEAKKLAKKHGIDPNRVTKTNLPDELMKLFRDKLIQPTFLTDYPIGLAPLAKPKRGDPSKAEIFQPFIGGLEVGRAYSELSDPKIQAEHFSEQENERKVGNEEAMPTDKDFVNALEYGLPPACGVGIGIERVTMLFTDSDTIRDVIMFPFMKPLENKDKEKE
jgi:lysyl-tRNA synthetase class 2